MRTAVRLLLVAVTVGALLFLFVIPGRTWLNQSSSTSAAQRRLRILSTENSALSTKVAQLHDPAYLEQLARQQYGLVLPGEKAYGILPVAPTTTTVAPTPPSPPTTTAAG
jgi:cell division protein FtsB